MMRNSTQRIKRGLLWSLTAILLLAIATTLWAYQTLRASLPLVQGEQPLVGLSASVQIERDAAGVATLTAANRLDASRALGFLHAQERFFQMDILRRRAAGELSELVGEAVLELDRSARIHRFRQRATALLEQMSAADLEQLHAYTDGVNAGLATLKQRPFEYIVLRQPPAAWQPADTLLTIYAMYLQLHARQIDLQTTRGLLWDQLPEDVAAFLDPQGTIWDAPLDTTQVELVGIPDAYQFDLRNLYPQSLVESLPETPDQGSNAWAVAGGLTVHGGAVLANDMHLELSVPNTWYRVVLRYGEPQRQIVGVTLPGAPAIVVGSNGHLAWGFTNSQGDWSDLITLEVTEQGDYRTPDGNRSFEHYHEPLVVAGGQDQRLTIRETHWGPVVDEDHHGHPRVLRWTAHHPQAVNLDLIRLETAEDVNTGLDIAKRTGIPNQNILLADASGQIAWTIAGPMPKRAGCDTRRPLNWQVADACWLGWLPPTQYPYILNPSGQRLWSANARQVGGSALTHLGDGGYALGVRAQQIREALQALDQVSETDLLAIQLEDHSVLMHAWRSRLRAVVDQSAIAAVPERAILRDIVAGEHIPQASIDAVDYRLIQQFRFEVSQRVFAPLNSWLQSQDERFDYAHIRQREGPLWTLVNQQPTHWLNPEFSDWQALLLDAADAVIERIGAEQLAQARWGEVNILHMQHPLSQVLPWGQRWLDMPTQALPGAVHVPRVQSPRNGASQRLVVSPGREEQGLFHMPGGQSGHPLSPYYRAGHEDWVMGHPSPLLPGAVRYTLYLHPG